MPDDRHLHNAAATLQAILARRQPEYRWTVEVRPLERAHGAGALADRADQVSPGCTAGNDDAPI